MGKVLINILGEHYEDVVFAVERFEPDTIVFVCDRTKNGEDDMRHLKEFLVDRYDKPIVIEYYCGKFDFECLEDKLLKYKDEEVVVNLTGGGKLVSLVMYALSEKYDFKSVFVDIKHQTLVYLDDFKTTMVRERMMELTVEEVLESIGATIVEDSTDQYRKAEVIKMTNLIASNLKLWNKIKSLIVADGIFSHDEKDSKIAYLNVKRLHPDVLAAFNEMFRRLKDIGVLVYTTSKTSVHVEFKSVAYRNFFFKTGTWLEALTQRVMEEINEFDDIRSSMMFLWDMDSETLRNELDVVAVRDSVLVCVSCKDSSRYDERALNELYIYADRLGGENAVKVLVATSLPAKSVVLDRAREMGIDIVIYDGDFKKFKARLKSILSHNI